MLRSEKLFSEFEFGEELGVAGFVLSLEIVQQTTTLTNELEKTKAGSVVFGVLLKVWVKSVDAISDQCDLNFGGSSVRTFGAEGLNHIGFFGLDFGFTSFAHLHVSVSLKK
jgi:hypothetical protein